MLELVLIEIVALPAERSRGRHQPRVVKRKMSNFPTKSRAAPASRQRFRYEEHVRIMAPAGAAVGEPLRPPLSPQRALWLEHVRSWQVSGLKRAAYCQRHGLELRRFHGWIARLRPSLRPPTKNKVRSS
jgi:hypothetical protein